MRAAAAARAATGARVEGRVLDVRDGDAIDALAAELGEVDIVFSNATARMSPDADPADEVDAVAQTSNLATTPMLRAFAPRLRPGGRLIVVASALGHAGQARRRASGRGSRPRPASLDAVDALVAEWRDAVHAGRAEQEGFGTWLNIPSKVAQVAAVRAVARERRAADLAEGRLIAALCPGLIDTDASRPWFADMSQAQTPAQAAAWPVELALGERFDPAFYGELVQFGAVIPWKTGVPVAHKARRRRPAPARQADATSGARAAARAPRAAPAARRAGRRRTARGAP